MLSTVTWIGSSGDWSMGSNWSNGTGPGAGDDAVIDVPGITVTHDSGSHSVQNLTVNDAFLLSGGILTVAGNLQEQNGNQFSLNGGILAGATVVAGTTLLGSSGGALDGVTLAGTLDIRVGFVVVDVAHGLTLDGGTVQMGGVSLVRFDGTQSLAGTGSLVFVESDPRATVAVAGAGAKLTISPGVTIRGGAGNLDAGDDSIDNQGSISATGPGKLVINGTNWTNEGTITATGPGAVELDGSWTNTGALGPTWVASSASTERPGTTAEPSTPLTTPP